MKEGPRRGLQIKKTVLINPFRQSLAVWDNLKKEEQLFLGRNNTGVIEAVLKKIERTG
jgi:hypothetical protein